MPFMNPDVRRLICMQKWFKNGNSPKWYVLHHGLIQQIHNVSLYSTQRPDYYSTVTLSFSKKKNGLSCYTKKSNRKISLFSKRYKGRFTETNNVGDYNW